MPKFALGAAGLVLLAVAFSGTALATPYHAVSAGRACDTCHIEPTGWENPELALRKCTLDCTGCHTSPTGGGMRKPAGRYYGKEAAATFGARPGVHGDPERYRREGEEPTPNARYRLWEGFSGWAEGDTPMEEVEDRFGNIDPDPRFSIGGDFRFMGYFPKGREESVFPMQTDLYLMGKATDHLTMYATLGYLGRRDREPDEIRKEKLKTVVALREVFAQIDDLAYGGYLRAGRFNKPHGWRIPDHTSFVRRDAGFDQNAQAFGVEAGINPNMPYANLMLFYQGSDDWPGDVIEKGYGTAFTAGYRGLGAQVGMSLQYLRPERGGNELTVGPLWALNAYPLTYLGEVDFKSRAGGPEGLTINSLFSYNEVQLHVVQGLNLMAKYDWMDPSLTWKGDQRHRYSVGVEWNPINHTQLVVQYRWSFLANRRSDEDLILMSHFWF